MSDLSLVPSAIVPCEAIRLCSGCGGENDREGQRYCRFCHAKYMRLWRKTHHLVGEARLKFIARSYAGVYLKRGLLKEQPCEDCGSDQVEIHHDDYSKPLQVRWKCRPCHLEHHRAEHTSALRAVVERALG